MIDPLKVEVGGSHYKGFKIQPIEFIFANNIPFIEGSIIKYAARWRDKGGLEDLEKIKHYCDLLIKLETDVQDSIQGNGKISPNQKDIREFKKSLGIS